IVKNVHHVHQAEPITEALIRERLAARDRFLAPLARERDAILAANRDVAAALVEPCEHQHRIALAQRAARRVHAAFNLAVRDRDRLERSLLRRLWPLDRTALTRRESACEAASRPHACLTPHTGISHLSPRPT